VFATGCNQSATADNVASEMAAQAEAAAPPPPEDAPAEVALEFTSIDAPSEQGQPSVLNFAAKGGSGSGTMQFTDFKQATAAEVELELANVKVEPVLCKATREVVGQITAYGGYRCTITDKDGNRLGCYVVGENGIMMMAEGCKGNLKSEMKFAAKLKDSIKSRYFIYSKDSGKDPLMAIEYVGNLTPTTMELNPLDGDIYNCTFYDGSLKIYPKSLVGDLKDEVPANNQAYSGAPCATGG
jgi:hypothetical protein